jgi:DHA1 family multidrug resistance protein-like MFS transporter
MPVQFRLARVALFACVFLAVFTEVLLSPYYPQFFHKVFGVEDLDYTAYYIFVCRLTVIVCAPLWGWLARFFGAKRLIMIGQGTAAVCTALVTTVDDVRLFLLLSIVLLAFKSSYLLLYPLIVQLSGEGNSAATTGNYQAVFHGAVILSTLVGGWAISLAEPLQVFWVLAAADLLQLGLFFTVLNKIKMKPNTKRVCAAQLNGNVFGWMLLLGVMMFTFHFIVNMVRPYFTVYTAEAFHTSGLAGGVLFMIPSMMAMIAMPFIKRWCVSDRLGKIYVIGMCTVTVSLIMQGISGMMAAIVFGRMLYGFFIAICQAALEVRLFEGSGGNNVHFNYSVASTFQNAGLLIAPFAASWMVTQNGLAAPFIAAVGLCLINLIIAPLSFFPQMKMKVINKE